MSIAIYILLFALYGVLPIPIQIIVFLADILIPDPIPLFDELLLLMAFSSKIAIIEFLDDIGPAGCLIIAVIIIAIIVLAGCALYKFGYNILPAGLL